MSLKTFWGQCVRVFKGIKQPSKKEFWNVAKISALGIAVIGAIGFIIGIIFIFII